MFLRRRHLHRLYSNCTFVAVGCDFFQIVPDRNKQILQFDLGQASKVKALKSHRTFDSGKYRLDNMLSLGINLFPLRGVELGAHGLDFFIDLPAPDRTAFWAFRAPAKLRTLKALVTSIDAIISIALAVFGITEQKGVTPRADKHIFVAMVNEVLLIKLRCLFTIAATLVCVVGDIGVDVVIRFQFFQIAVIAVTGIGRDDVHFVVGVFLRPIDHWDQLLSIIGLVGDIGGDNHLTLFIDAGLGKVKHLDHIVNDPAKVIIVDEVLHTLGGNIMF